MNAPKLRIGIDLGGTKTEYAVMDPAGALLVRQRQATRPDYNEQLRAMVAGLAELESRFGPARVGIAHPGSMSPHTGLIRNANSTWLNDRPLQADLQAVLNRPIRLANDADCFALSEAADGAASGHRCVFGVILGTGVGGGIVIDRAVHTGRQGLAGEWGHTPLPWMQSDEYPGPACWCGRRGCIEAFLSGPALAADHAEATGPSRVCSVESMVAAARAGNAGAAASLERHAGRLSRALAGIVDILDPDIIVLGGGLSNLPGLAQRVATGLRPHVFSDQVDTPVVTARHGDSSGVRGAAWLWPAEGTE
ncbi:ROK family protein [Maricaulis sp. CAU 1757]